MLCLKTTPIFNDLSALQKEELKKAATYYNKTFLNDIADTITLESECGQCFAVPRSVANKSGFLKPILSQYLQDKIPLPLSAFCLNLYSKACWFQKYTDSLYWMRSYREIQENEIQSLLNTADYFLDDFCINTINDRNDR